MADTTTVVNPNTPSGTGDGRPKASIGSIVASLLAGATLVVQILTQAQHYFPVVPPVVVTAQPAAQPSQPAPIQPAPGVVGTTASNPGPAPTAQVKAWVAEEIAAWEAKQPKATVYLMAAPEQQSQKAEAAKPRSPDVPPSGGRP